MVMSGTTILAATRDTSIPRTHIRSLIQVFSNWNHWHPWLKVLYMQNDFSGTQYWQCQEAWNPAQCSRIFTNFENDITLVKTKFGFGDRVDEFEIEKTDDSGNTRIKYRLYLTGMCAVFQNDRTRKIADLSRVMFDGLSMCIAPLEMYSEASEIA
jgi:hypothetical protein